MLAIILIIIFGGALVLSCIWTIISHWIDTFARIDALETNTVTTAAMSDIDIDIDSNDINDMSLYI